MNGPLLYTKLHRPQVDSNHVYRSHLLARLNQYGDMPLSLISTPAGYGKSVLISSWMEACEDPGAWLSLDENDSDLRTFINYFIAAVQSIFPKACLDTQAQIKQLELPPIEYLGASLANELDLIKQPFILILDDYYLIKGIAVHDLVARIMKYPPQFFHLVIISRRDPPLPISSLRAKGLLIEIRTEELCFSAAETEMLLSRLLGIQVDKTTVVALVKKTEGWVTGLRFAALSMRQRMDIDPKLLEPHVDAQYVMEYLFNEVFSRQPPEISRYLLVTAVLDRFCGPLCEAVCAPGADPITCEMSGWEFITWLKKENIFVISLDLEKRWFRYHHLFRKLLFNQLKRRFSAREIKALHIRAGEWYVENGLIEEALQHYLTADDISTAMQLVGRYGPQLMNDQQWSRLTHWLDLLPRDQVELNPELLLLESWLFHIRHDLSNQWRCFEKIEAMEASSSSPNLLINAEHVQGQLAAMRGMKHYFAGDGEGALRHLRHACEIIPTQHKRVRVFAHIYQLGAYQMIGELASGLLIYQEEMRDCTARDRSYHSTYLTNLCFIYWIDADLNSMRQTAESALIAAKDHQLPDTIPYVYYFRGIYHYHRNELEIAEDLMVKVVEDHRYSSPVNYAHSAFALALTLQARKKFAEARKVSEALITYAIETNNADMIMLTRAFEAELALRQGRVAEATQLAIKLPALKLQPVYRYYMPQLTLIQILLFQDTMDSRRRAADLLDQSITYFRSIRNKRFQIELLALQALYHDSQNDEPAALKSLAEALTIAEPSGFIRIFVDLGPRMAELLKQLIQRNTAVTYIKRILSAFADDAQHIVTPSPSPPTSPSLISPASQLLAEPLTTRETEILNLLKQRLQNKEIATQLRISPGTVKKHLNNIYGKLSVSDRRQAVDKAMDLGILTTR